MNSPTDEIAAFFINTLFDSAIEPIRFDEVLTAFRALLSPIHFEEIMMECGICPDHFQDIELCAQDNADCIGGEKK